MYIICIIEWRWKWKLLSPVQLFATPWSVCIVHGIPQARILEWVAFPFSRGSSQPRNQTRVSCIAGGFLTNWVMREAPFDRIIDNNLYKYKKLFREKIKECLSSTWVREDNKIKEILLVVNIQCIKYLRCSWSSKIE